MTDAQQTNQWPHITALLDQKGGHITIGRMPPIENAAIAVNDQALIASLVRREGESFPELLQRLDAAIGKALHEGAVTNEVNGGRFLSISTSIRGNSPQQGRSIGPIRYLVNDAVYGLLITHNFPLYLIGL
jgi:hypothetical protein